MKKTVIALCGTAALLSAAACSSTATPRSLPPGEYSRTERSVAPSGTETEKTTKTNVYYDQYGNKKAVQETETSRDPEGLFNKSTSKSTKTYN